MPCYIIGHNSEGNTFLCGRLGPHCRGSKCGDIGENLCDFPVSNGKTCDMAICHSHSFEVAPNMHYCPAHTAMWREFRESGGVRRELENVVPYKQQDKGNDQ